MFRFPKFRTNPEYLKYLNSPEWKALRDAVIKRCQGICERCKKYLVDEVHHLTYDRLYHEALEDLQGLCEPCHEYLHNKLPVDPLEPPQELGDVRTPHLVGPLDGHA